MILMATLSRSGNLKASLTSAVAPVPSTLLRRYLEVSSSGNSSLGFSLLKKTKTFFSGVQKLMVSYCSSG